MLGFFRNVLNMKSRKIVPVEELDYMVSVLNSASTKAHYNERVRANVLNVARKVRDAVHHHSFPGKSRKCALIALNRVKIHALVSGAPEDYTLFVQLDRITRELEGTA